MIKRWNHWLKPLTLGIGALLTFFAQTPYAMAAADMAEAQQSAFEVEVFNPKKIRPVVNGQEHVRLCLMNTDVHIGCDIPPNGSLDLTFPINGRITLQGKYLLASNDDFFSNIIPGSTDIVLWRQSGDDPTTSASSLQARAGETPRSFKDYIVTSYVNYAGNISTVFSFNIPREEAYFGLASNFEDSGGSLVESDDNKLNWSISLILLKDESTDPFVCEFIKMATDSNNCLVPQNLALSTVDDSGPNFLWNGLPKLSFIY